MRANTAEIATIAGGTAVASVALVFAMSLSPAFSAVSDARHAAGSAQLALGETITVGDEDSYRGSKVSLKMLGSIGSFTPVTRDERLARAYAEAARESHTRSFKFTPTSGSANGERSLTVVVRETADRPVAKRSTPNLGLAPVTYSLGRSKGLGRFAMESGIDREPEPLVAGIELPTSNFVLQAKRNRFSTNLQVEPRDQTATPPTNETPQTLGAEKSYTVDVSSSYSLTRNLDVQAGVRYRGPDNRLVPLTDQAQDSQAVYVGTKFKF